MSCYKLRPAWKSKEPNKNGKFEITFAKKGSQLEEDYMIPCGKCRGCLAEKRRDWAIRIYHESQMHEQNCFVTLTYENPPDVLQVKHVQDFISRARKDTKLRYFFCGEYGEKTGRPHYHAILFGTDLRDLDRTYPLNNEQLYGSPWLDRKWGYGFASVGDVTMSSACYVAGYVNKKLDDSDTFTLMSRNPPIGYPWCQTHTEVLQRREKVVIEGKELPIPAAYLQWFDCSKFRKQQIDLDHVKANRRGHIRHRTPQQLRAMEKNHEARDKLKKGETF